MDNSVVTRPRRYGALNKIGLATLLQREIMRFWRVLGQTVVGPLVSTLLLMMAFTLAFPGGAWGNTALPHAHGLAPGLVMMAVISNAFQNSSSSMVIAKVNGNSVDFLMPPLSALELTIAFIAGAVVRGVLVGLTGLAIIGIFQMAPIWPQQIWAALYFALVGSIIFGAIGLLGGIWADKFDDIAAVTNFIVTPLTFLSGTFYSIDALPEPFSTLGHWNPVFFLIDGFRYGFIGVADAPIWISAVACGAVAVALCVACWLVLRSGYKLRT